MNASHWEAGRTFMAIAQAWDAKSVVASELGEPDRARPRFTGAEELVDVSASAAEAGFRVPVAMTRAAWRDCVEWTAQTAATKPVPQDELGRLWDVVWMAAFAARKARGSQRFAFSL